MLGLRPWHRGDRGRPHDRLVFVDGYTFPVNLLAEHQARSALDDDQMALLVAGTRQWTRVRARAGHKRTAQPSRGVHDLWGDLATAAPDLVALCGGPDSATPVGPSAPASGSAQALALRRTYLLACLDEDARPPHLPLLMRLDWALDRLDATTFVPNCGEVRFCAASATEICLDHLDHAPRRRSVWREPTEGTRGLEYM